MAIRFGPSAVFTHVCGGVRFRGLDVGFDCDQCHQAEGIVKFVLFLVGICFAWALGDLIGPLSYAFLSLRAGVTRVILITAYLTGGFAFPFAPFMYPPTVEAFPLLAFARGVVSVSMATEAWPVVWFPL